MLTWARAEVTEITEKNSIDSTISMWRIFNSPFLSVIGLAQIGTGMFYDVSHSPIDVTESTASRWRPQVCTSRR